jgi:hypothetical protein
VLEVDSVVGTWDEAVGVEIPELLTSFTKVVELVWKNVDL